MAMLKSASQRLLTMDVAKRAHTACQKADVGFGG